MCGIAGVFYPDKNDALPGLADSMAATLKHRGPDDSGVYRYASGDISLELIHLRLKIIDLSFDAHQPMTNEDGSLWLVYNGEIYNHIDLRQELISLGHSFKSHSDSEVVIHAYEEWGEECLHKFIGMWAFAIWDERKKALFASRDRLGIKPFYYFYNKGVFIFASEIKAILEHPLVKRRADIQAIYEYLYLGYSLDDKTWIKEVFCLNPAHYLILDRGNLSLKRYWEPQIKPDYSLDQEKASLSLRKIFTESVQLMLGADVEVATHLSGGIDSSSIAAVAHRLSGGKIRAFSGVFQEGPDFDETVYINELTGKYGMLNERVTIKPDNFIENMKRIVWHMDEPVVGPGGYSQYFLSKAINLGGIKVVLGGQGGDELFGGYPYYYSGILSSIRRLTKSREKYDYRQFYKTKDFWLKLAPAYLRKQASAFLSSRKKRIGRILNKEIISQVDFKELEERCAFYKGTFEDMELWDINNYLPALLQVEDRLSMAFSVETRLPFLNHNLVEFALRIPFYLKVNSLNFKYILRLALKDYLPKPIFERTDKKGFPTPIKIWLRNSGLRADINSQINSAASRLFTDKALTWEKINIGLWLQNFRINL